MMDDEPLSQDIEDETEEVLSGINKPPMGQSFKEAQELSFSGQSPSVHSDFEMLVEKEEQKNNQPAMNKDDKLTQSQMLARMLAAEERDNIRMQEGSQRRNREETNEQNNQDAEV